MIKALSLNVVRIELQDREADSAIVFTKEGPEATWRMIGYQQWSDLSRRQRTLIMTDMMTSSVLAVIGKFVDTRQERLTVAETSLSGVAEPVTSPQTVARK